ncbi:TPA: hypothetical protein ACJ66N_001287, partial [Streptococcus pyogenes]
LNIIGFYVYNYLTASIQDRLLHQVGMTKFLTYLPPFFVLEDKRIFLILHTKNRPQLRERLVFYLRRQ